MLYLVKTANRNSLLWQLIKDLKIRRQGRQWKHGLKSSFNLHRDSSNSITLSNVGEHFWSWIPEKPYPSSEWERKFHSSLLTSSIKCDIRHFLVVVVQWRQRNVQKSVMHVQSCCFANPNLLLFWSSCCRRRHRILRSFFFTNTDTMSWQL